MRVLVTIALVFAAAPARAEPVPPAPRAPHVVHVPTAWVQPRDRAYGSAGLDHRGGGFVDAVASLGGLAEVELLVTDELAACNPCGEGRRVEPTWLGAAGFKLGAAPGAWFRHQPALALGLRASFAGRVARHMAAEPDVAMLYAVASAEPGGVRLHAGAALWDAAARLGPDRVRLDGMPVRPFGGVEWAPRQYPRTTVLADLAWAPELGRAIALRWVGGWGVRYQALSWGSIELAVRHREGDDLSGATVMVRVHGVVGR